MITFARFLEQNLEAVVGDFESFARTAGPSAAHLSSNDLRDHAMSVLKAIAADVTTEQSPSSQQEKAEGRAVDCHHSLIRKTARLHAQHRFQQGFTLPQMLSEYRALRASVIRRWREQLVGGGIDQLEELTRFGEAVDEGLTEAIVWYSKRLEDSRNLLIGIMAHDLRTPLGAVQMSAQYLLRTDRLQDGDLRAVTRIATSTARMAIYVNDLLDFTQTLLGKGLQLDRKALNLATLCEDLIDELRAGHPSATIELRNDGESTGFLDGPRLSQLVSNLVANAIMHGNAARPVNVVVSGADGIASISVHNEGDPIPQEHLPTLFHPLMQAPSPERAFRGSSGLGLGLHIAREIAMAHGGTLHVLSDADAGTTFTVELPLGAR